jgi:hypothetical protein
MQRFFACEEGAISCECNRFGGISPAGLKILLRWGARDGRENRESGDFEMKREARQTLPGADWNKVEAFAQSVDWTPRCGMILAKCALNSSD